MRWMILVPLLVGAATVLQGGLNRIVSERWGLAATVVFNNTAIVALSIALWMVVRLSPNIFPVFFNDRGAWADVRWWWFFPAVCGVIIVAGIPWAMARLGAVPVLVGIVAAQMVVGIAWDFWVESQPITLYRVGGAALAVAGVALASIKPVG